MERLVIAWSPERSGCDTLALDRNGNRRGPIARDVAFEAVRAPEAGCEVIWIVPGLHVVAAGARLPVKGRDKILRALPFALEERFAEDPERLFFALAAGASGAPVQAAAVERDWFQAALAALSGHGLEPAHAVPDFLLLPWRADTWTALADAGMLYVREAQGLGFALEADVGWAVLKRRIADTPESRRPAAIRFLRGREPYGPVPDLELLEPERETRPEGLLGVVPEALSERALPIDLLQGAFGRRQPWQPLVRPWLPAIGALATVVLLALAGFVAGWVQAAHANAALQREIRTRFHAVLPGAAWIDESTARAQVTQRLQQNAGSGARRGDLLRLLETLAAAGRDGIEVQSLSFSSGSLQVQVHAPQVSTLDEFRAAIARHGVSATLRSANQTKSGVDGALVISAGGAP